MARAAVGADLARSLNGFSAYDHIPLELREHAIFIIVFQYLLNSLIVMISNPALRFSL